ncbi:DNA repair protein Rad-50 [Entamoeba marina]
MVLCSLTPKLLLILGIMCIFANGTTTNQTNTLNANLIVKDLSKVIIPRFQQHIQSIQIEHPKIKHQLQIEVTKLVKARKTQQKRIEEIKVNMEKIIARLKTLEKKKKQLTTELRKQSNNKDNKKTLNKSKLTKITLSCARIGDKLKRMQNGQKRLVKNVEKLGIAIHIKKNTLKKSDKVLKIRIARNVKKIKEIQRLIKEYNEAHQTKVHVKLAIAHKKTNKVIDEEYHILKRNMNKVVLKEQSLIEQLNNILNAMNIRYEAKTKYERAKTKINGELKNVKSQMKKDKAVLKRAVLKKKLLKKRITLTTNSVASNTTNTTNTTIITNALNVNVHRINDEIRGLRIRIRDNSRMTKSLQRKLHLTTKTYINKKKSIESHITRQRLVALKVERRKLVKDLHKNRRRYLKVERALLMKQNPNRLNDYKKRMSALKNEEIDLLSKLKYNKEYITDYYTARTRKFNELKHRIGIEQPILKRRLITLRRLRALNEKKFAAEKIANKRHMIHHTIKSLTNKIKALVKKIHSYTHTTRKITLRNARKAEHILLHHQRKQAMYRKLFKSLTDDKKKYSKDKQLKRILPQVNRRIQEITMKNEKNQKQLIKAENKARQLDNDVHQIKKFELEEAQRKSVHIKKMIHVTNSRLNALKGRKGKRARDMIEMLNNRVSRLRNREKRQALLLEEKNRKSGVARFSMKYRTVYTQYKIVKHLKQRLQKVERKINRMNTLGKKLQNLVIGGVQGQQTESKNDQINTSMNLLLIKKEKLLNQIHNENSLLKQYIIAARGAGEASVQAHTNHIKSISSQKNALIKSKHSNSESTQLEIHYISSLLNRTEKSLYDLKMQITDLSSLSKKSTTITTLNHSSNPRCDVCLQLAKMALVKHNVHGVSRTQTLHELDDVCRNSEHSSLCYKTLVALGSKVFVDNATPLSVCENIHQC